ncbi:MAG: aspartate/glutamate racemase family protein [bacterium]
MLYHARRGQASYGEAIGILLLDTSFAPYIPGDVANASSYSFPVRYQVVKGLTVERIFKKDSSFLDKFLTAGQELVESGVRAITGNCGFMAIYQKELARRLTVPVFLSSLLQLSFMTRMIGNGEKVGIITANAGILDDVLLHEVGLQDTNSVIIKGMEDKEHFREAIIEEVGWLDSKKMEKEVVSVVEKMVKENPAIKMILLECACLPPYGAAVQKAVNLPVFDFITMINYVYSAVVKKEFHGFM